MSKPQTKSRYAERSARNGRFIYSTLYQSWRSALKEGRTNQAHAIAADHSRAFGMHSHTVHEPDVAIEVLV